MLYSSTSKQALLELFHVTMDVTRTAFFNDFKVGLWMFFFNGSKVPLSLVKVGSADSSCVCVMSLCSDLTELWLWWTLRVFPVYLTQIYNMSTRDFCAFYQQHLWCSGFIFSAVCPVQGCMHQKWHHVSCVGPKAPSQRVVAHLQMFVTRHLLHMWGFSFQDGHVQRFFLFICLFTIKVPFSWTSQRLEGISLNLAQTSAWTQGWTD